MIRRYPPWFPLALSLASLAGLHAAEPVPTRSGTVSRPVESNDVRIEKDIAYLGPERTEKADLYQPAQVAPGQGPAYGVSCCTLLLTRSPDLSARRDCTSLTCLTGRNVQQPDPIWVPTAERPILTGSGSDG